MRAKIEVETVRLRGADEKRMNVMNDSIRMRMTKRGRKTKSAKIEQERKRV